MQNFYNNNRINVLSKQILYGMPVAYTQVNIIIHLIGNF